MTRAFSIVAAFTVLGSISPARAAQPAGLVPPSKEALELWTKTCAACHGPDGKAQTMLGKRFQIRDMTSPEFQRSVSDQQIRDAIAKGVERTIDGKAKKMPKFSDLAAEKLEWLVRVVRGWGLPQKGS